jgi:oligopeptide/dipeptide ABC transporter ATP-binding protein
MTVSPVLDATGLVRYYPITSGWFGKTKWLRAVDNIDIRIAPRESVALVGESGCGKSTTARLLAQLEPCDSGSIALEGCSAGGAQGRALKEYRQRVQLIFQDPLESLNPRHSVRQIISRPLINYGLAKRDGLVRQVEELLEMVGLAPASPFLGRYPHELSGGQRQRVGIAAALAVKPRLLIADEPVASLDISVRAQILRLLQRLRDELRLSLLFISHDLGVVRSLCDTTAIMYLGKIVEIGPTEQVFANPTHPYTRALIAATPIADPRARRKRLLAPGEAPSALDPPSGCSFHPRCPLAKSVCSIDQPLLRATGEAHWSACHFACRQEPAPRAAVNAGCS